MKCVNEFSTRPLTPHEYPPTVVGVHSQKFVVSVLAGRRRRGRGRPRGVGGALHRGPAPDLGAALVLHPVRTQWVGSTAVAPIAHSRGLVEHLPTKLQSLSSSLPPSLRCHLLFLVANVPQRRGEHAHFSLHKKKERKKEK